MTYSTHEAAVTDSSRVAQNGGKHMQRILGTPSLLMFGLAYLVPLTVFTTFGTVTKTTEGHLPLAYIVTTIAMLFTALSYAALVRVIPSAGSAYAYAREAFGDKIGFLTGWTLLLDYLLLPAINYLIIGIYLHAQFPEVPAPVFIVASISVVTILNLVGVDSVRRTSVLLVIAQLVFAAIFVVAAFRHDSTSLTFAPFYSADVQLLPLLAGAAILCLSFLGFDAVSTLSEEARDPARTVPRAIMLTTLIGGALFILLSYAGAVVIGDWRTIKASDSAGLEVMAPLGPSISAFFIAAYIAGCIASAVASQASVSRILYAMGREGALPNRWFGHLSPRYKTPNYAILTVAAISLMTMFATLDSLALLISFGALFAFSIVNLAVISIFGDDLRSRSPKALFRFGICPLIGLGLTLWLWFSLSPMALLIGLLWLLIGGTILLARKGKLVLPE